MCQNHVASANQADVAQNVEGGGGLEEKCLTCAGTGKAFSKAVAVRVFQDSCNAIVDSMNAITAPSKTPERDTTPLRKAVTGHLKVSVGEKDSKLEKKNEMKETVSVVEGKTTDEFDIKQYNFWDDGCGTKKINNTSYSFTCESASGRSNYILQSAVNLRTQGKFLDERGGVRVTYSAADTLLLSFPTPKARRLWTSAMHSGYNKMLEWIDTAIANKVSHVEKELPESTFECGYAYACVDLIPYGAQNEYHYNQLFKRYLDDVQFVKTARRIEFKCIIDSKDNTNFDVELRVGCGGEFPVVLYSCRHRTVNKIQSDVHNRLQIVCPDSLANVWHAQTLRNALFKDNVNGEDVCKRLNVQNKKRFDSSKKFADKSREVYNDFCLLDWDDYVPGRSICLTVKDSADNWNYVLMLGANGVPQRQVFRYGRFYERDFVFDRHLIVFPTEESRNLWYKFVRKSCGQMLEWVELASKKRVPVVVKPISFSDKDGENQLVSYYNLITKGKGQDELLASALREHISPMEYRKSGHPVSLICHIERKDLHYKEFYVWIELKCGDKCYKSIFSGRGTYEAIQEKCMKFLYMIDPDMLIGAWKEKYGRGDLFK